MKAKKIVQISLIILVLLILSLIFYSKFFKKIEVTETKEPLIEKTNDEIYNSNIIKDVRGRGLLIGLQLNFDQTKFIQQLIDNKLLTIRAAENVIRILPPLNVKKSEINTALKIIKKVCKNYKI